MRCNDMTKKRPSAFRLCENCDSIFETSRTLQRFCTIPCVERARKRRLYWANPDKFRRRMQARSRQPDAQRKKNAYMQTWRDQNAHRLRIYYSTLRQRKTLFRFLTDLETLHRRILDGCD